MPLSTKDLRAKERSSENAMCVSCSMSRHVARPCRRCAPRDRGAWYRSGGPRCPRTISASARTSAERELLYEEERVVRTMARGPYERDCMRASPARRTDTQREVAGVSDQAPRGVLGCARSGHRARGVCGCRCRTSSRPCSSQPTGKSGEALRQVCAAPGPARSS